MLYVDEQPVQYYFSNNMFYYETEQEQGSIFLAHHGLMADVVIRREGQRICCKASTQLQYHMTYQADGKEKTLDATFGMGIDSSRKAYFYCGLDCNGEEIIPLPEGEKEQKNQGILSISYREETRNLICDWKTDGYALLQDPDGQLVFPDFQIRKMRMEFDALYKSCDVTIWEGENQVKTYPVAAASMQGSSPSEGRFRGDCQIAYETGAGRQELELFGIDWMAEQDASGKEVVYSFCGLRWNGETLFAAPKDRAEQKSQHFLHIFPIGDQWLLSVDGKNLQQYLAQHGGQREGFCLASVSLMGEEGSVIETQQREIQYHTKGTLLVPRRLEEARKQFRLNAAASAALKGRCLAAGMNQKPLTLEQLCSILPPSVLIHTQDETGKVVEIPFDGQQYCSYKNAEMIMDLVNYYGGDIANGDQSMKFEDLFGKTRAASREAIRSVSPQILTEIENAEDPEAHFSKGYLPAFLRELAPIVLAGSLAKRTEAEIVKGFGGAQKEEEALAKSRFYLSYLPEEEDQANSSGEQADNDKTVLSTRPEYHRLTAILDQYVYLSLIPELYDYLNDPRTDHEGQKAGQTAREYWAEGMYYSYVETIQMLQMNYAVDPSRVTHIIKVLGILDSQEHDIRDAIDGDVVRDAGGHVLRTSYALALYAKLSDYAILQITDTFQGDPDYENYYSLLTALYGSFYDKYKNQEIVLPQEVEAAMQEFLEQSREIFLQWAVLQAQELMQFMIATGSMSSALLKYNPKVPGLVKFFSAANILVASVSFANVFMDWDQLTSLQKAESILSVLQAGFSMGREFVLWKTVNTIFDPQAKPEERMNAFYRYQAGGCSFDTLESVSFHGNDPFDLKSHVEQHARRYARNLATQSDYAKMKLDWGSKLFVIGDAVFQVMNLALVGIAFVADVIELNKMFQKKGSYTEAVLVLSTINTALTGAALLVGGAEFILGFTSLATGFAVASVLPVVNAVLMGAMFVLSIVMMILHEEPEAPITRLIREKIAGAVEALDAPSQRWIQVNTPKSLAPA